MALVRIAARVDARFLLAALGLAAAMVVPVAGSFATAGLQATVDRDTPWLALGQGEQGLTLPESPRPAWVLEERESGPDGLTLVAFTEGDPVVGPGEAYDGGPAGRTLHVGSRELVTVAKEAPVGAGLVLVHPDVLGSGKVRAALYPTQVDLIGATVAPARGADAFEQRSIADLRDGSVLLVLASLPLVALVAAAFMHLEARRMATMSGVFGALGHPREALLVIAARSAVLALAATVGCLAAVAVGLAAGVWPQGQEVPTLVLAAVLGLPALTAAVTGAVIGIAQGRRVLRNLRRSPTFGDEPRVPGVPLPLRPWIVGWRLVGVLAVVGLVVGMDVGLPLAAAEVPAALAGVPGEWVIGPRSSRITQDSVSAAPASVMAMDPAIDAIVAERFVLTLVQGDPTVLRGGEWDALADYHGLRLTRGSPPGPAGIVLGQALAERSGLRLGDAVWAFGEEDRVARFVVSGVFEGPRFLEDEGVVRGEAARVLADLPAGKAHALRMRPDTPEAVQALRRSGPRIEFTSLQVLPVDAPAGSIAMASLEAVNLGGGPGSRPVNLRVNELSVASVTVALDAYSRTSVTIPFRVPAGAFLIEVNPDASGTGTAAARSVSAPAAVVVGRSFSVHIEGSPAAGVAVGLYSNLTDAAAGRSPLSTAVTGSDGVAVLTASQPGPRVVATADGVVHAAPVHVVAAADAGRPRLVVETVFVDPSPPVVGQFAQVAVRVRNVGGVAGERDLNVTVDGVRVDFLRASLGAGEVATLSVPFVPQRAGERVAVDGVNAPGGGSRLESGSLVTLPDARSGGSLQADVADSLLGNARAVLSTLALTAGTAALVLLVLGARRTLAQRAGVAALLATMWSHEHVKRRAAIEAGILGGIGGLAGVLASKGVVAAIATFGDVHPFGHRLPDPFTPFVVLQVVSLLVFLCAVTLHLATDRLLRRRSWRSLEGLD